MAKLPKHHYIPVFYLKQWAGADGRLCEFSRPFREVAPRMTHPDGTGYQRGLYTFNALAAATAEHLERVFFDLADDRASAALRGLLAGEVSSLSPGSIHGWSRFIMTLFHRVPERVEQIVKQVTTQTPESLREARNAWPSIRRPTDPETYDEFIADKGPEMMQRTAIMVLQRVMDSKLVGDALNHMQWGVITIGEAAYPLLTSDRPIVMTNGLRAPGGHFLIPISPRHVFIAANEGRTIEEVGRLRASELAKRLNDRVARQARRYVYGTDDRQLRFVANRLGEKARWSPVE